MIDNIESAKKKGREAEFCFAWLYLRTTVAVAAKGLH